MFGRGELRFGFFACGEDAAGLAVGEWVEGVGDALGEGVVFKVVGDHVEVVGGGVEEGLAGFVGHDVFGCVLMVDEKMMYLRDEINFWLMMMLMKYSN